ncbi:hypothetical protein C1E23_14665 [Pseudoalteromonas phenolica]|uniref:Diguanylate phosphodiesterase n=1 Tax=Pseudoalteromonas phenolica TaxID=161398 RepID=A0A4Q7IJG0_9GAMM|nr:EAL domain-containing protein [Pseudoalteromonas phenolica]RZQ52283.1 hypothetical protein C1E23_14665 [Pseudoalteromonas phenolica]
MKLILTIFLLILLFCSHLANANVSRLSPAEGLSQSYVNTLLLDNQGFLWLATEAGLNRYDGHQILHVSGPDGVLEEVVLNRIYQDSQDRVWIVTQSVGLFSYDTTSDTYRTYLPAPKTEADYRNNSVFEITEKDADHIWLGKRNSVALLNVETGKIVNEVKLPVDSNRISVRKLLAYKDFLFIATTDGAYVYHQTTDQIKPIKYIDEVTHEYQSNTKRLYLKDSNTLLLGAVKGLYEIDISELTQQFSSPSINWRYKTLFEDINIWDIEPHDDHLLLATDKGLLHFWPDIGKKERDQRLLDSKFTLADNSIIDLVKDGDEGLWLATKSDGAFYLSEQVERFHNVSNQSVMGSGFSHNTVWRMVELDGYIWAATNDGLTRYDPRNNETQIFLKGYEGEDVYPEFSIYTLHLYEEKLWLETNRGLFIYDPKTDSATQLEGLTAEDTALLQERLYGVYVSEEGFVYFIHVDHGFYKYSIRDKSLLKLEGQFDQFDPFLSFSFLKPLPDNPSHPLFFTGGTLYRFDPVFQKLHTIYEVPDAHEDIPIIVQSYIIDKNNVLWLSLSNYGLIGLDPQSYERVHTIDLEENNLGTLMYGMEQDDAGMIWMSSHKGIWRLDPDNLHLQQFTTADGLLSNEFNGGAALSLDNGQIAYGSVKGFTLFDPKVNRPKNKLLSRVNITSVELMSRKLEKSGLKVFEQIELQHDDIGLEVSFSAMSFMYQDRIIYEYQISGGQRILTRGNNRVVFPKLNPGNYQLKVWAKDPLTGDYTPPTSLMIKVHYPIWRSPLAIASYVFTILLLFALWLRRKQRIEQILLAAHKDTQNSEMRLKLALESSDSGVWDWQLDHHLIYQPRLTAELGYHSDTVTLDEYLQKIHPFERNTFRLEWLEFVTTNKGVFNCTYRLQHKDGHWRWYKDSGKVMAWASDLPERVTGTYTNLTREKMFAERARLFGAAFEQARDWVFILDKQLRIQACNAALQQAFDIAEEPTSSSALSLGLPISIRMHYLRKISQLKVSEYFVGEELVGLANGKQCHVLIKVTAVSDGDGLLSNYVVALTDISAQKKTEQTLQQLENINSATQLADKGRFIDWVEHAISQKEHGQSLAVMAIRVDRLKHFYDIYGKHFFESLIKHIAKQLIHCLGEQANLAFVNGREFMVLLEKLDEPSQVTQCITKIKQQFEFEQLIDGHNIQLMPFIGVASLPEDATIAEELCQKARMALNHAMDEQGRDYQFFTRAMQARAERIFAIEQTLMLSLKEGNFVNQYQPILNYQTKQVEGLEVTLKWPSLDTYSQHEVSEVSKQIGASHRLLLQALSAGLIELKQWHLTHPELYLAINLTASDLMQSDLLSRIANVISRCNIHAHHVVFEITEALTVLNSSQAIHMMTQLKSIGCQIHINGFGSEFASLASLQSLPVDAFKIAPTLITQQQGEQGIITHAVISVANLLDKRCIADGVQNESQIRELQSIGCHLFQGPIYGEAITGDYVAQYLDDAWHVFSEVKQTQTEV